MKLELNPTAATLIQILMSWWTTTGLSNLSIVNIQGRQLFVICVCVLGEGAIPFIIEYLAASLASIHEMPVIPLFSPDDQKCLQRLSDTVLGVNLLPGEPLDLHNNPIFSSSAQNLSHCQ